MTISEYLAESRIIATSAPDGRATIRLGNRELNITRRTEIDATSMAGICPLELIGVSLAA